MDDNSIREPSASNSKPSKPRAKGGANRKRSSHAKRTNRRKAQHHLNGCGLDKKRNGKAKAMNMDMTVNQAVIAFLGALAMLGVLYSFWSRDLWTRRFARF
jgi:hypothetical protein